MNIEERIKKRFEELKERPGGFNLRVFAGQANVSYNKLWNFMKRGGNLSAIEAERIETILSDVHS